MGTELTRRTGTYDAADLSERKAWAASLASAGELLPQNYWTKPVMGPSGMIPAAPSPGKVLFMLETAAMLGIPPMAGLTSIHIIEGKPTLSASLWASLVREAGHRLRVWVEGEGETLKAVAELVRKDDPDFTFRVEWSHDDARKADLLGKGNWKKYERAMLKSRAITEVVREGAPEVGMGAAYSPEELRPDLPVNADGVPVELQQVPEAHYTSGGDGTEPPRQQRQAPRQAPIVDPQAQAPQPSHDGTPTPQEQAAPAAPTPTGEVEFDWTDAVIGVRTRAEAEVLYQQGVRDGKLNMPITIGGQTKELGALIIEIGKAFAEKEQREADEADAVEATIDPDDSDTPAVLADDSNVQDAQVVQE